MWPAESGRIPLQLSWYALAGKFLECLENMDAERMLKQAFVAGCSPRPPCHGGPFLRLSWRTTCRSQVQQRIIPSTKFSSLQSAQRQHLEQLDVQTSSKTALYRSIKVAYGREPSIQRTSNRYLSHALAQFRTGPQWLDI